ncbi:Uncharacterised protein [Bordetella pertussis]|nr:Uncharacterised protein [Bordetella pertussis]
MGAQGRGSALETARAVSLPALTSGSTTDQASMWKVLRPAARSDIAVMSL